MTLRRDFLAFTAGAVAARTALPITAKAERSPQVVPLGPDAELIRVCVEFPSQIDAYNKSDWRGRFEMDPLWKAYERSRDIISAAKPRSVEGIIAKARAAKAEAVGFYGEDAPCGTMGEIWAWDLIGDLLAAADA